LHKGGFGDPLTLLRALLRGFQGDERCGERYGVPGRRFFEGRDKRRAVEKSRLSKSNGQASRTRNINGKT